MTDPDQQADTGDHQATNATDAKTRELQNSRLAKVMGGDEFSVGEAMGGWRGFLESALPGIVFVVAYLTTDDFQIPVIASVATVVILVIVRLIQRTSIQQALTGVVGVAIGAVWAWRSGEAGDYFVPGLWINAAYGAGALLSMAVRWPLVGIVMGLIKGWGTSWRDHAPTLRRMQWGTAILAALFLVRLGVQWPLYMADAVAALGTARLAMGVPLFALTLWGVWLLVRSATPVQEQPDPPQPRQ